MKKSTFKYMIMVVLAIEKAQYSNIKSQCVGVQKLIGVNLCTSPQRLLCLRASFNISYLLLLNESTPNLMTTVVIYY